MEGCLFCRIIRGESEAHVVFADSLSVAFLDIRPLFVGHTLVVPREHHETLADLPTGLVEPLFLRVQTLSAILQRPFGAQGSFVALNNIVSQSVPHLHVHVVPRSRGDGLRGFFWPRTSYTGDDHMRETARLLGDAFGEAWTAQS